MNRNIEVLKAKDGNYNIKVDGTFMYSQYYPIKASETFIDFQKEIYENEKIIVVYGVSLGYHLIQLLNKLNEDCEVYVFDVDEEIIEIAENLNTLEILKKDKRCILYLGEENFKKYFNKVLLKVKDILIYPQSLTALPASYEGIKELLENFQCRRKSIKKFGSQLIDNQSYNEELHCSGLAELYKNIHVENSPVIVVSSGPSLDLNLEELKQLSGKIKIFSVGSALRTLMKAGIKPDVVTIIDGQDVVYNQFMGFEGLDVPLCFLSTASRNVTSQYKGPKYRFYNDNKKGEIKIKTGNTVALATIDIAVKGGAREIILVGQDLCFIDKRSHTYTFDETYGTENKIEYGEKSIYSDVQCNDGQLRKTNKEYLLFKRNIEEEIRENPQVKFVNCSLGAKISGTEIKKLKEYI